MDTTNLIAYLPFDTSATKDLCGNTWTASGNPTIQGEELQLDGSSYLQLQNVNLGGQHFSISGYVNMDSTSPNNARIIHITNSSGYALLTLRKNADDPTKLDFWVNSTAAASADSGYTQVSTIESVGKRVHFEIDYKYTTTRSVTLYIDGVQAARRTSVSAFTRKAHTITIGANASGNQGIIGAIDELMIYDGTLLHSAAFTPPTEEDYLQTKLALAPNDYAYVLLERDGSAPLSLNFDVERKIKNPLLTWRYENPGTADTLTIAGTTLTDLPKSKSVTGTAFYQTTRAKCFPLAAAPEVWLKFDVYFDGTNRWRAYNDGATGDTGLSAQTNGTLTYWINMGATEANFAGVCKVNQRQTVLLHMISGSSAGVIEAWVDGDFIYSYTGNVNNGQDFADLYLQSDGAGTFFSNIVISNAQIGFGDGYHNISFDVERTLSNRFEISFDVQRILIQSIVVPPIGEHFNHFVPSLTIFRGGTQRIILPKRSKVYVRASGAGIVKFFSDTDSEGVISGTDFVSSSNLYAELNECENVFPEILPATTARQIIKTFMNLLVQGEDIANAAEICSNYGRTSTMKAYLSSTLVFDTFSSENYTDFLENYCGIILDNEDTGSLLGLDASGGEIKTAHSVVNELTPVEDWIEPVAGSSTMIDGLTVHWPVFGASGVFTDDEKFILKGLNSEWIARSLELIDKSFGLNFTDGRAYINEITVNFINDSRNPSVASVVVSVENNVPSSLELVINQNYCAGIDTTSADGELPLVENVYLDRILAHEFTHAVMAANIRKYQSLSPAIREGAAELVHGIDDMRKEEIVELLTSDEDEGKIFYELVLGYRDIYGSYPDIKSHPLYYAAGYVFLRYMIKRGQANASSLVPDEITLSNLLISDGATDSDYEALTDNTRQIFSADVLRVLATSVDLIYDVEILQVVSVEFLADVTRSLLSHVFLFPRNKSDFFSDETNPYVVRPKNSLLSIKKLRASLPANTKGLQNFEVSIAEQQITDQLRFTAVTPFDIMQQVSGQYLDYIYDMRVERIQQQGILYSCECCSDIDQLLYTQMNYTLPETTTWHKIDGKLVDGYGREIEETEEAQEIETVYPFASKHVEQIAGALGLSHVTQFEDFLSTVLMDEQGGVTYNDLLRDIFGWSSRIPTKLINIFIREGKLFVIERGHESNMIDISKAKMTMPIVTRELVRTTWGSTPWSKTETKEWTSNKVVPADKVVDDSGETGSAAQYRDSTVNFNGASSYGYTSYNYNNKGLLMSVESHVTQKDTGDTTRTTINYDYDSDGTMTQADTYVINHTSDGEHTSRSIDEKSYKTLATGEKFLSVEQTSKYEDGELVDYQVTTHSPTRVGQTHVTTSSSSGIVGQAGGQNTGDDRITPYSNRKAVELESYYDPKSQSWIQEQAHESGTTTHGLSLYDSSFPIHNEDKLIAVTNELKNLNRKTKETVNVTLYDFEHLIDFDDRISLDGATYFLSANTARTTPRIKFEQNLTLVRWY